MQTKPYEPHPVLRSAYRRFFDHIAVDETWADRIRELAARGTVVYVLQSRNFVDFLALDHLAKRCGLPEVQWVTDLGLWVLDPDMGRGMWDRLLGRERSPLLELEHAVENGASAVLFMERRGLLGAVLGSRRKDAMVEGEALLRKLLDLQRDRPEPILLVPQVFVWNRRPGGRGPSPLDSVLEPREWPSAATSIGRLLYNARNVRLHAGEPLDLREVLAHSQQNRLDDTTVLRRVSFTLLRRLERERRAISGREDKAPDRVQLEILRSPKLQSAVRDLAGDRPADQEALTAQALSMLQELQATPDSATLTGLHMVFSRIVRQLYKDIEIDAADIERIRAAAGGDATLVLLPSHRSHIDYLVLTYIFLEHGLTPPVIAAGDNLNFFPMGPIFRRGGAFFIRRTFRGDRLYTAVVDAYIRRLIRDGQPIEVFLEGARSRTGKLLEPKFGLLNMIIEAALTVPSRTVKFVPVHIGYEHIADAPAIERELRGAEKRKESAGELLRTPAVFRYRYGRLTFQAGTILTLDDIRGELGLPAGELGPAKRRAVVTRLGNRVMDEINGATAINAAAVGALILLSAGAPVRHAELVERTERLVRVLSRRGARVTPSLSGGRGRSTADRVREAAQLFVDLDLVEAHSDSGAQRSLRERLLGSRRADDGAVYHVPELKRLGLDTTKNTIIHFFVERGMVSVALLSLGRAAARAAVSRRTAELMALFALEFRFPAGLSDSALADATIDAMLSDGELEARGDQLGAGPGHEGWSGERWVALYGSIVRNFLEGYRVGARSLTALLRGPLAEKDLIRKGLAAGARMLAAGDIRRREAVNKPLLENAYRALQDAGYLRRDETRWALPESLQTADAVATVESRLASYLWVDAP